jgi:hypothetical protein
VPQTVNNRISLFGQVNGLADAFSALTKILHRILNAARALVRDGNKVKMCILIGLGYKAQVKSTDNKSFLTFVISIGKKSEGF